MRIRYEHAPQWPRLAWLASVNEGGTELHVKHGSQVEVRDTWFVEATWDGPFDGGDFDRTDVVYGSGCRLREGGAVFVPAASVSDRLQYCRLGRTWYVSNSLSCLVSVLALDIDPWYLNYYEDFFSICTGIEDYKRDLQTEPGPVFLHYYHNLAWNGRSLHPDPKPLTRRDFSSFEKYLTFLNETMSALARNLRDEARTTQYEPVATASSGYDSLAASVLARDIGNRDVITFNTNRADRDDSGADMVRQLGQRPWIFQRNEWRRHALAEVPFIAADASGRESLFAVAEGLLPRRALFSGYHGGTAWGIAPRSIGSTLARGDNAGLGLTEFRLQAGFFHCPVPQMGIRQHEDIVAISQSVEMQPWSVGGRYDRPIPRRIIEESGIERDAFGREKSAANVHLFKQQEFMRFMSGSESFRDYMAWLRRLSKDRPPTRKYKLPKHRRANISVPWFRHLFPWAVEHMKRLYDASREST